MLSGSTRTNDSRGKQSLLESQDSTRLLPAPIGPAVKTIQLSVGMSQVMPVLASLLGDRFREGTYEI